MDRKFTSSSSQDPREPLSDKLAELQETRREDKGCPDEETVSGYYDGELIKKNLFRWVRTYWHVKKCDECQRELEELATLLPESTSPAWVLVWSFFKQPKVCGSLAMMLLCIFVVQFHWSRPIYMGQNDSANNNNASGEKEYVDFGNCRDCFGLQISQDGSTLKIDNRRLEKLNKNKKLLVYMIAEYKSSQPNSESVKYLIFPLQQKDGSTMRNDIESLSRTGVAVDISLPFGYDQVVVHGYVRNNKVELASQNVRAPILEHPYQPSSKELEDIQRNCSEIQEIKSSSFPSIEIDFSTCE
jgi:hypothetical protein